MKKIVILYPTILASHFAPMMQLVDVLLEEGYTVAVAVIDITMEQDVGDATFAATVDRAASSRRLSVSFHTLPRIRDPPSVTHGAGKASTTFGGAPDSPFYDMHRKNKHETLIMEKHIAKSIHNSSLRLHGRTPLTTYIVPKGTKNLKTGLSQNLDSICQLMTKQLDLLLINLELLRRYNKRLRGFLCSMPPGSVHALVVDVVSVDAFGLRIPVYTFYLTSTSTLAVFLQLPSIRAQGQPSFRELGDAHLNFHGVPPMPASHLMSKMLEDPETEIYKVADGILVNTFASLEARAVGSLRDSWFLPDSKCTIPPVYFIGPLVVESGDGAKGKHECIAWLDEQPEQSVVFLCFGSMAEARFSEAQLKEIAVGLENSGHRFLWVAVGPADPDLDVLLPEGFLERTNGRGLVVKQWALQVDVLRHKATGLFVTHCGWNSVLEGITAGVPMLCLPLYSEQKMNKVFMVEEAGIGVEVVGWQQGLVRSEEVEARARVTAHKEAATMAWKNGSSSRSAFSQFLSDAAGIGTGKTRV
uniref:Glycosyltransferase n=1 Tax=Setaria viridis TaxID=4556 RepID=A0A4U6VIN0_SETVI|nr:hypothetical protein SEVIR_3G249100v2 [Setaria viridis]